MFSNFRQAVWASGFFTASMFLITHAETAAAQTATNLICNGCVGSADIANGAVRSADIANGAVATSDIKNYDIRSIDMFPNINLGRAGDDGDFTVRNSTGTPSARLNGDNANVTNRFENISGQSNGLVKAWARINADGTIASCWRCNTDPNQTRRVAVGQFEVDFSPLGPDITERPRTVILDALATGTAPEGIARVADRNGDASSVFVGPDDLTGAGVDLPFVVVIY